MSSCKGAGQSSWWSLWQKTQTSRMNGAVSAFSFHKRSRSTKTYLSRSFSCLLLCTIPAFGMLIPIEVKRRQDRECHEKEFLLPTLVLLLKTLRLLTCFPYFKTSEDKRKAVCMGDKGLLTKKGWVEGNGLL